MAVALFYVLAPLNAVSDDDKNDVDECLHAVMELFHILLYQNEVRNIGKGYD